MRKGNHNFAGRNNDTFKAGSYYVGAALPGAEPTVKRPHTKRATAQAAHLALCEHSAKSLLALVEVKDMHCLNHLRNGGLMFLQAHCVENGKTLLLTMQGNSVEMFSKWDR